MRAWRFLPAAVAIASILQAASQPSAVAKILDLFHRLQEAQHHGTTHPQHVSFQLTEAEINEYLAYALDVRPRPGLKSVTAKIFPDGYYSTISVVDFDAVERWSPGTIPRALAPYGDGRKDDLGRFSR